MNVQYLTLLAILSLCWTAALPARAQSVVLDIAFPTDASQVTFQNDFGDPRAGHAHEGIDLIGPKMTPLYSAVDGEVSYIVDPEPSYGYMIVLRDQQGYTYHYIHVNNDTPGTDDGNGGTEYAYAPGINRGASVSKGQLIGWMGDSGNAESIASHLHFEIRQDGEPINPYPSLMELVNEARYDPAFAQAQSPDINTDKALTAGGEPAPCVSGTLVKPETSTAVYYCGANSKRYVFPNDRAYFTWYQDFSDVLTISDEAMAAIPLGGNVTYRPGVKMIKIQSDPSVYAVDTGGVLRWVKTQELAEALYGQNWAKQVEDVSDAFFFNYTIGEPITNA
jgi:hypothetical protein